MPGRALVKRATRNTGCVSISNGVTNLSDFRALFKRRAEICVNGFEDSRAMSRRCVSNNGSRCRARRGPAVTMSSPVIACGFSF